MNKLVIYTSPTCGPCRQLKPVLTELAETNLIPLEIVDASDETRKQFEDAGIRAVPTVICIRNGQEHSRFTGSPTRTEIQKHIKNWGLLVAI